LVVASVMRYFVDIISWLLRFGFGLSIVDSRSYAEAIQSPARITNGAIAPVSGSGESHILFRTCLPALWRKGPRVQDQTPQGWQRFIAFLVWNSFSSIVLFLDFQPSPRGQDLLLLFLPVWQLLLSGKALHYELFKHPKQLLGSSNSNTLA
jgi:hypothetical protein